ncbi:Octicosapeptide/Phox/Bem1p family protein [Striga hermonthica]|uniref:Octicosapeptide/Phox/Bem1p family protein n=1 Tax=Striga hermonthica TaxID=68872 RepID=A0A9N7NZX1_STRHE|nr:Octicosapeptide/Phox/Bem1p family protein [Striga hermonthica]
MEKQNFGLITKVKLLCSYGGRIQFRPTDRQLSYAGGDTKILAFDRGIKFSEMAAKLSSLCEKLEVSIKYQLPGEDLDALVSLIDDEDVEHMMVEYERLQRISPKPVRLRLFLFDPSKSGAGKDSVPVTPSNPDYLFGFDKEYEPSVEPPLDLLQIPGMVLPDSNGLVRAEGKIGNMVSQVSGGANNESVGGATAAPWAVYRVPAVVNGGICHAAPYAYGIVPEMRNSNREQPVYNFIPIMATAVPEQMMMISRGNTNLINQRDF